LSKRDCLLGTTRGGRGNGKGDWGVNMIKVHILYIYSYICIYMKIASGNPLKIVQEEED
jgi:hypothetical protein